MPMALTVTATQTIGRRSVYASVPATMADDESLRLADCNCIVQLGQWMSKTKLKLNADN